MKEVFKMNTLTAIRSFGKPGYCPTKTRVQNNKWYLVEMQDVETDPRCDYVGLKDTTTIYLMPGKIAREKRQARLNHCNRIAEYTSNVFALTSNKQRITEFYTSIELAENAKQKHEQSIAISLEKAIQSILKQQAETDEQIIAFYGKCKDWPGNEQRQVKKHREELAKLYQRNIEYWQPDFAIEQIR